MYQVFQLLIFSPYNFLLQIYSKKYLLNFFAQGIYFLADGGGDNVRGVQGYRGRERTVGLVWRLVPPVRRSSHLSQQRRSKRKQQQRTGK